MLDPTTFSTTSEVDRFFDDSIKKAAAARIVQKIADENLTTR
jgi:hypothetical protein